MQFVSFNRPTFMSVDMANVMKATNKTFNLGHTFSPQPISRTVHEFIGSNQ